MTIDLNKNGIDDLEEIMDVVHARLAADAKNTEAAVEEYVANNVYTFERAKGVDVNGDGVVGNPNPAVIDLNGNGEDDLEEIMHEMHDRLAEAAKSTEAIVEDYAENNLYPLEEAMGVDINGDGVVGKPNA